MKFKNLRFPEFPAVSSLKMLKPGANQSEYRMKKFRELFDQLLIYAQQYHQISEQLMKMLYMFLISKATPFKK